MKKYNSMYLAICVQNDDPEKRGRIKVWVPHVNATLYESWNKQAKDKVFKFPGKNNNNEDLSEIMEDLKDILPWAECASPIFGGSSSGRYNASSNEGSTSDSSYHTEQLVDGQRPLHNYTDTKEYPDEFTKVGKINNSLTNPYTSQYKPSNYSNLARGLFTIPNVGAHVWVFFRDGNASSPVYFAVSYGEEDWKRIYTLNQDEKDNSSVDYPGTNENDILSNPYSNDAKTFRSKTVFNSNKHTIELIDTDNREILKFTHYAGSFKEFGNEVTTELAIANDQKQVLGDQFLTVRKNRSSYVQGLNEEIIKGSNIRWVGLSDKEKVQAIVDKLKTLNEYKRLFDIKRADWWDWGPGQMAFSQERVGTRANCPVCDKRQYTPGSMWITGALPRATPLYIPTSSAMGIVASLFEIGWIPDPPTPAKALGAGSIGYYMGSKCDVCNGEHFEKIAPIGYNVGEGSSPSSEGGSWQIDAGKKSNIEAWIAGNFTDIVNLERELDMSNEIITISNNKIETIGLVMNDIPSIRTDPFGKLRIGGVFTACEGTYKTYRTAPLTEYVDVDDVPGGDYNLTVTNKYKLLVGARGISIKTFGPIDMYGTIVNLAAEQINLSSQNEMNFEGGQRINIRARTIALLPHEHNPVVVDGQLHVTGNAIVGGSMMVEGELGVKHLTGPSQYYETLPGTPGATEIAGKVDGQAPLPHSHGIPPHTHYFINLPINLERSDPELRARMISIGINETGGVTT